MKYCEPILNKAQWICKNCKNSMNSVAEKKECKTFGDFKDTFSSIFGGGI